ncbi:hypothetical protein B0H14DRAFT_3674386, partial [Mycena olivaceomarginata]
GSHPRCHRSDDSHHLATDGHGGTRRRVESRRRKVRMNSYAQQKHRSNTLIAPNVNDDAEPRPARLWAVKSDHTQENLHADQEIRHIPPQATRSSGNPTQFQETRHTARLSWLGRQQRLTMPWGEQFEAFLASGVMASNRNELSHRTAHNAKRHTSAIEKAKNMSAGNNKIKELKAELAILMAEAKMELDGVEMVSLEVRIEPGIQPDALEPENDVDSDKASPSEPNLDVDGEGDSKIISMGDLDVIGLVLALKLSLVGILLTQAQQKSKIGLSSHIRTVSGRSSPVRATGATAFYPTIFTKAGASKTHEDAPVRKSKKTEAAVAPEPSSSGKRRTTRKHKAWSIKHTDDRIYTSFEFLAQFPDEYRALRLSLWILLPVAYLQVCEVECSWIGKNKITSSTSVDGSGETGNIFGSNAV